MGNSSQCNVFLFSKTMCTIENIKQLWGVFCFSVYVISDILKTTWTYFILSLRSMLSPSSAGQDDCQSTAVVWWASTICFHDLRTHRGLVHDVEPPQSPIYRFDLDSDLNLANRYNKKSRKIQIWLFFSLWINGNCKFVFCNWWFGCGKGLCR